MPRMFFFSTKAVKSTLLPHALYVALAQGDATVEAMAGQTLRLAN